MPGQRIARLLVANRGEIARRVIRTAHAMGIGTVAVYANPDANSPHVGEADIAVPLHGATSAQTYLDSCKLIDAAKRTCADAVHPGYGFLAENAAFAAAVIDAGLTWVGPPPDAIATMGDKLTALDRMRSAGVPTLPRVPAGDLDGEALTSAAQDVGYPLLVKATAGGGGKGMRVVRDPAELDESVAAARRESLAAFGSGVVFLERYLDPARHIEVQVVADRHGRVSHLFERECSVQRRHQKVVEEAPSPFLTAELRERMCAAAVRAAEAVDYVGAGTVEFVAGGEGEFYFLEMNTRLQVEHPVTECVSGVDLVRLQLEVARGERLDLAGIQARGVAIEARVYAEDPAAGFLPSSGRLVDWREPSGVRVDSGVAAGEEVTVHYDPMLAKVIAHAPTRPEAAEVLARALDELRAHGPVTNRGFLAGLLRHPEFLAGHTTTGFIDDHLGELIEAPSPDRVATAATCAALAARESRTAADPSRLAVPAGWRNNQGAGERASYTHADTVVEVQYREERDGTVAGDAAGRSFRAEIRRWTPPWLELVLDGVKRRFSVVMDGVGVWVQDMSGEVALAELPRFPDPQLAVVTGGLTAPMNGTVVRVDVATGDEISAGQTLLALEAMKMEHRIRAPADGLVQDVRVGQGDTVATDDVLVVVGESTAT